MKYAPLIQEPAVVLEPSLLTLQEEGQVVVHCRLPHFPQGKIRIWPSTFLVPRDGGEHAALVHAENITVAPTWTDMPHSGDAFFTLIFSPLPKGCQSFDMVEVPHDGLVPFEVFNIPRNESDVYRVNI